MRVSTLDILQRGSRGEILAVSDTAGRGARLRRVGIREGAIIEVMSDHDPVLLRLEGCSVAVGRELLAAVTICRCGCEKEDPASQSTNGARRRVAGGHHA